MVMTSHRVEISSKGPSGNTQEAPLSLIDPAIGRRGSNGCGVCERGVGVLGVEGERSWWGDKDIVYQTR